MKGNEQLLTVLNSLLADEFTAINQYMVHSEICGNWGYNKLHQAIRKQAMDEMNHAEWLIERILFYDGIPVVSKINQIRIGKTVLEMVNNDNYSELNAVDAYNDAIKFSREIKDQGTLDLLTKILNMEEIHVDWAEMQLAQVVQMGMQNYLVNQI